MAGAGARMGLSRRKGHFVVTGRGDYSAARQECLVWPVSVRDNHNPYHDGSWSYEADPDGVESVCDGVGHGNGGSPERDLWRAARV